MENSTKALIIRFLFLPIYGLYVFALVSVLNLFVLSNLFSSYLTSNSDWGFILWGTILIPSILIITVLKKVKIFIDLTAPVIQTIITITIFLPLSEFVLPFTAHYIFEQEAQPPYIISETPLIQNTLEKQNNDCQEIIFHPSESRLEKEKIRYNLGKTSLSKAAESSILNSTELLYSDSVFTDLDAYLFQGTLYINKVNQKTFELIGIQLAKNLIHCKDPNLVAEKDPKYSLLTTEQYQSIRQEEIGDRISKLNTAMKDLDNNIHDYKKWLREARTMYSENRAPQLLTYIHQAEKDIKVLEQYRKEYTGLIANMQDSTATISRESGVFLSPNTIHVELVTNNPEQNTEHTISTILHEYLHYISHQEGTSFPAFFNEGITELLNIDIKRQNSLYVQSYTYQGRVYIIRRMLEDIDYSELTDIYFAQDTKKLIAIIDKAYGKDFYKNNKQYFTLIEDLPSYEIITPINALLTNMKKKEISFDEYLRYPGSYNSEISGGQLH